MRKYLLVEGVPGRLVPNPFADRSFLGMRRDFKAPDGIDHCDRFKPEPQVVEYAAEILHEISNGNLKLLDRCVAANESAARADFDSKTKRAKPSANKPQS